MMEAVQCVVLGDRDAVRGPIVRYELLNRMWRNTQKQGVRIIAFGLGTDDFRWILSGDPENITEVLRGFKVGTCRRSQGRFRLSAWERTPVVAEHVAARIAWAHAVPWGNGVGPLNPWTSEIDGRGFRVAGFFDPVALQAIVGASHWSSSETSYTDLEETYSLRFLMRLAAAVVGRLPGHHKSFRLFVQLARFFGWAYSDIASALHVSRRRVRQLDQGREPLLWTALLGLGEPRLWGVP